MAEQLLLTDSLATSTRIIKSIKTLFSKAKSDDIVVFFFSGHGNRGKIVAYDRMLGFNEIRKAMAGSRAKNKMIFVDACFSGTMRIDETSDNVETDAAKRSNIMLFLSCRNNETSGEKKYMKNGFFTTYLQKGLRGGADVNHDRTITAKELFNYVHRKVVKLSKGRQHPVMWGNFSDDMPVMQW